jgi:hypothetical protein
MTLVLRCPSKTKPDFSNTRAEAGLFAYASTEIRWSGKVSNQKSVKAATASVMMPRPQNFSPSQYSNPAVCRYVLAGVNTNSAVRCALNLNAKFRCRLFAYRSTQEFVRIVDRVRMRKNIAQAEPDLATVGVLRQPLRVIQSSRTNRAALQNEPHRTIWSRI